MLRGVLRVAVVSLPLVAWSGSASAQSGYRVGRGYVGAGSTVQGDIARGLGFYYDGLGNLIVDTAVARSIDTNTLIKWNQYVYESIKEHNLDRARHILARRELNKKTLEETLKRIRENPTESDLMSGDALNMVLQDLSNPGISGSSLRNRATRVPLASESIVHIPFQYARVGGVISMRKLTVRDGWPLALRSKAFESEKAAYKKAVDQVIEEDLENKLTPESVKALDQAVRALEAKMKATIPVGERDFYVAAQAFIKDLDEASRMMRVPLVEAVIAEIETYPGTTVADLLDFMRRFNLRFSPAEAPSERQLYKALYGLLVRQRELLTLNGNAADPPPPEPAATPP